MVQRYFLTAILVTSILVVSCRQDDEISTEKTEIINFSAKETSKEADSPSSYAKIDSTSTEIITPTDPPKNGTHWKLAQDSINILEETTDPPKNGTHWKTKN